MGSIRDHYVFADVIYIRRVARSRARSTEVTDHEDPRNASLRVQQFFERNNRLAELLSESTRSPLLEALEALEDKPAICRLIENVERTRELSRLAAGPLAALVDSGVLDRASLALPGSQRTRQLISGFESRLDLPRVESAAHLIDQLRPAPLADLIARSGAATSSLQAALDRMQEQWLAVQESLRTVGGFAEIQGIGALVERLPAFDEQVSSALRVELGDWRDPITWPSEIFTDQLARSSFYLGLGFDSVLTDLPESVFGESVEIAGLRRAPPPLVRAYGAPVSRSEDPQEEEALQRTNAAHGWLLRLETQVRKFIDERMTRAFGPEWPKHQLPNGLYDKWKKKKIDLGKRAATDGPLIAFADFTDYERVICRGDNWRIAFAGSFGRPESIRETLQRLYPIRLDTMHARTITQDDELLLYVETRRLMKVIDE